MPIVMSAQCVMHNFKTVCCKIQHTVHISNVKVILKYSKARNHCKNSNRTLVI